MAKGHKSKPRKKTAPAKRKSSKSASKSAPVRQRDFKAEYKKRIERALAAGKTRQQARGHKAQEHIERREREIEEAGISRSQTTSVKNFLKRFNPAGFKDIPDEEDLVEFIQENGYPAFQKYRKVWDHARNKYVKEKAADEYESRGLPYLISLTGEAEAPDEHWLYYH